MKVVYISGVNLYKDLGIVLEDFEIGEPEVKRVKVSIPGRDGDLDMSKALTGYTNYGNRMIVLHLGVTGTETECDQKRKAVYELIYQGEVSLVFSHLSGYFTGRCHIKDYKRGIHHYTLTLECDCQPYRVKSKSKTISMNLDAGKQRGTVTVIMPTYPVIEVTGEAQVKYGNTTHQLVKGTHIMTTPFKPGLNSYTCTGKGQLNLSYQEGVI